MPLFGVVQKCRLIRGKLVGGTSALDCMTYVRGSRHDYDKWSSVIGCRGWAYDDVLPYFINSERNTNKEFIKSGMIYDMFVPSDFDSYSTYLCM